MTYFGTRFGCRWGMPHDMVMIAENQHQIWEKCKICGVQKHWNKGYKGRIKNAEYLKIHIRNYAQELGATKRVFYKIYKPEKTIIFI